MKRTVLFMVGILMLSVDARAQEQSPLRLEDAIQFALKNNRGFLIAGQNLRKAQARVEEAKGAGRLQIAGDATYTRFDEVAKARFGLQEIPLGNIDNRTARLTLTQPVDISGIIRTAKQAAALFAEASRLEYEKAKNELILHVTTAYQDVLRAEAFVKVAEEALKNAQERLRITKVQIETGVAAKFDLLRAETQVAANQQALITARNALELAKASFNNVLGRDLNAPVQLVEIAELPSTSKSLEAYVQEALQLRPEVQAAEKNIQLAEKNLVNARRDQLPTMLINGQWQFNLNTAVFNPRRTVFTATAVVSMPIRDGGITAARVAQAENDLESARIGAQQIREGVALEVRSAYLSLKEAEQKIEVAKRGLEQAREGLRLARLRYEAGVAPQLEISDAEVAYTQAQTNLVSARYDYLYAWARLMKAIGRIGELEYGRKEV